MLRRITQYSRYLVLSVALIFSCFTNIFAEGNSHDIYTLNRFVNESIQVYSGLKIAKLNVDRLAYEMAKAASQLGWVITAEGGLARTASIYGLQSNVIDFGVGMEKVLESGNSLSVTGRYNYSKSDQVLFSLSPNPEDRTNLSLNFRIPLLEGKGNLKYVNAIRKARIEEQIERLNRHKIEEEFILKLIDVFYQVKTLNARLITAEKSLNRTKKLQRYIKNNIDLGLLEKGEVLQVDSQIYSLQLEKQKILDLKDQQIISINRFLKRPPGSKFITAGLNENQLEFSGKPAAVVSRVKNHSFDLKAGKLKLELLDSALALSRDREKSKLDVVMSVGIQNRSGVSGLGDVNDTDTTGQVRLEYRKALDKRAFSSERLQLQIDREKTREELKALNDDLEYETYSLINRILKSREIVNITKHRNRNEARKYNDILRRFKGGRSATNIVIQFDNERIRAELDYDTERHELEKRIAILTVKQGLFLTKNTQENFEEYSR